MRSPLPLPTPPLLLVTDRSQARGPLEDILAAAFSAGCRWASIREKDLSPAEQVAFARKLLPLARTHGATLTLHGDPALAKEAGLDGVHLPAGSDAQGARALLGPDALIGLSVHAGDDLAKIGSDALDYLIAGPAYDTASKPGYGPFLGPEGIASLSRATALPVVAIGGVEPHNAGALMQAGAAGIAVMGGMMRAVDPEAEARRLLAALMET